jgi:hypothetical protein
MSDQEAKPGRMPDPGTPFPLVSPTGMTFERAGSTDFLHLANTQSGWSAYYDVGGDRAAALALAIPNVEARWLYSQPPEGSDQLVLGVPTVESYGGSGTITQVGLSGTNQLTVYFTSENGPRQHLVTINDGLSRLTGFVTAGTSSGDMSRLTAEFNGEATGSSTGGALQHKPQWLSIWFDLGIRHGNAS